MEPTQEKLKVQIEQLAKALKTLEEVLAIPKTAIVRDSVIKRFGYVYELSWKTMKTACKFKGVVSTTPRDAMRAAFQAKLISDPEPWFKTIETRNEVAHTYKEELANDVYEKSKQFPPLARELLKSLQNLVD